MIGSNISVPDLSGGHPELVKAAIRMRGETLTNLALRQGLSECYLRNTLLRPLERGEKIIAAFLGTEPKHIWPDRYDEDGTPNYRKWRELRDAASRKRRRRARQ